VAQEKEWQKKAGLLDSTKVSTTGGPRQHARGKKTVANVRARVLPVGRTAQKRGRESIVSLGLGNPGRGEYPENGQRGSKSVIAAPWKWPMMAWSTVCDDYFRWPTNQELTAYTFVNFDEGFRLN
jgi:hypothetical protein